jgi:hypothetical protein
MTVRTRAERRRDTEQRLRTDIDLWVASGDQFGSPPHLIPLSFWWDGAALVLATSPVTVTGRNLETTGRVRLALGTPRDVVLVDGIAESLPTAELPTASADGFAAATGFDPRANAADYRYFVIRPERIQAWRNEAENAERTIYRDGDWLL